MFSALVADFFGQASYLIPLALIYGFISLLRSEKKNSGLITLFSGMVMAIAAIASELSLLHYIFDKSLISGGRLGEFVFTILNGVFGTAGAGLFAAGLLFAGLNILFDISWVQAGKWFWSTITEDYRSWMASRAELRAGIEEAKKTVTVRRAAAKEAEPAAEPSVQGELFPEVEKAKPAPTIVRAERKTKKEAASKTAEPAASAGQNNNFVLPSTDLLTPPPSERAIGPTDDEIHEATAKLESTLQSFDIKATVSGALAGPVITRYEIKPDPGVKVSSIVSLSNDIALAMKAKGIRVEAPIPGKDAIGFEIPNEKPAMVYLREIIEDDSFRRIKSVLGVALGRHADGAPATASLEKMPHLLVAGATNSGKSICLQTIIMSILYRAKPDQVKFMMIDPKRLELTFYENIPHLYDPKVPCEEATVITNPSGAVDSLKALVKVMELRYKIFEAAKVKNIESYNRWAAAHDSKPCFYIVVIIDEMADLMLQTKAAVEDSIQRLAQMARAVGIHLILSTQRPSVNVITGVIKANLPSRIALQVASKTDSRVILDSPGADALLGKGDMLFLAIDAQKPSRIQGAYVSEEEITRVADFLRAQGRPEYPIQLPEDKPTGMPEGINISVEDFRAALKLILERRRVSQDLLKAHFGSSARATNILSVLEIQGFIHKPEGSNKWEIFFDKIEHQLSLLDSQNMLQSPEESQPQEEDEP